MADPFIAEIRVFPFNFAPRGWAFCDGQILPIIQNTALFALLGTTYGGDGKTTFALPDLQGRAPMHPGHGPSLSPRHLGEWGGTETVTLLGAQIPQHTHALRGTSSDGELKIPAASRVLGRSGGGSAYQTSTAGLVPLAQQALTPAGGSAPHTNMQPYLTLNFCIALQGVFPPRS